MSRPMLTIWLRLSLLVLLLGWAQAAVYVGKDLTYHQPDGTSVPIKLYGDEFIAWFETPDGHTLVQDEKSREWCFARRDASGNLVSTGIRSDRGDAVSLGLPRRLRERGDVLRAKASHARSIRGGDHIDRRWQSKVASRRAARTAATSGVRNAPPATATVGSFAGLVVVVDFSDSTGDEDKLTDIAPFLNGDTFSKYGNSGSVKSFYHDFSNGLLTFTNQSTSSYLRLPHSKAYYNYVDGQVAKGFRDAGEAGMLLVTDAMGLLNAMSDTQRAALGIDYSSVTVDGNARSNGGLDAVSFYFAGANSDAWMLGLWPHSLPGGFYLPLSGNGSGKFVERYQITDIGNALELGTFAHECGHMLCGFPDLYNYASNTQEGVGQFCLMDTGSYNNGGHTPSRPCAYLRYTAGWLDGRLVDLAGLGLAAIGTQGTSNETVFIYGKDPGGNGAGSIASNPTEYFLLENRNNLASGMIWDRYLPDGGLAIWHIDETSSNTAASYVEHKECILVQADGRDDLGHAVNYGDSSDLFSQGSFSSFGDTTTPKAAWWNGVFSGLNITNVGAPGPELTFHFGPASPYIYSQPASPWMAHVGISTSIQVVAAGDPAPTYQWQRSANNGSTWTAITGATTSVLSLVPQAADFNNLFHCVVSNAGGSTTSDSALLAEIPPPTPPVITSTTSPQAPQTSADLAKENGRCGMGSGLGLVLVGCTLAWLRRRRSQI